MPSIVIQKLVGRKGDDALGLAGNQGAATVLQEEVQRRGSRFRPVFHLGPGTHAFQEVLEALAGIESVIADAGIPQEENGRPFVMKTTAHPNQQKHADRGSE